MIEITITIDEIIWPEAICGRLCKGCFKDDQRKESDSPLFRSGAVESDRTDKKRRQLFCSSRGNEGSAKREHAQRFYQREKPISGAREGIKKDPADLDAHGNDNTAAVSIFEEKSEDGTERFIRYILYEILHGAAGSQKSD